MLFHLNNDFTIREIPNKTIIDGINIVIHSVSKEIIVPEPPKRNHTIKSPVIIKNNFFTIL